MTKLKDGTIIPTPKMKKYIQNRLEGQKKVTAALNAGYSPEVARNTLDVIEARKGYQIAVEQILNDNNNKMLTVSRAIDKSFENDLERLTAKELVNIQAQLARIHQILTPKITVKETTDKNGNKSTTIWGSGTSDQMKGTNV